MRVLDPSSSRQRVVVVAAPGRLAEGIRAHDASWEVVTAESFLAGISLVAEPGVRAVMAGIEHGPRRLDAAVAGLRTAADSSVPIILCCPPHVEPLARRLLLAGADDYVIYPPLQEDLDAALGLRGNRQDARTAEVVPTNEVALTAEAASTVQMAQPTESVRPDELARLGDVLAGLDTGLGGVLERMADLARRALLAEGVEISAYGHAVQAGRPVTSPNVVGHLMVENQAVGQLVLGPPCDGAHDAGQIERFHNYVRLFSSALAARHRESQDWVSGLRNRRYLDQFLPEILERAAREQFRVTLLLFDVDNFKYYNDTYGHAAGDEIIRGIGQLMQQCCRSHDAVVRFGGDEFAVVFWDADEPRVVGSKHPTDPLTVTDRFRDALLRHQFRSLGPDACGRLTISGGLATYPWEASSAEELIVRADAALIAAKQQGKNRVLPFGSEGPSGGFDLPPGSNARSVPTPTAPEPTEEPETHTASEAPTAPTPAPPQPAEKPEMQTPSDTKGPQASISQRPDSGGILPWAGVVLVVVGWAFGLACVIYLASMLRTYLAAEDLVDVRPPKVDEQSAPAFAVIVAARNGPIDRPTEGLLTAPHPAEEPDTRTDGLARSIVIRPVRELAREAGARNPAATIPKEA